MALRKKRFLGRSISFCNNLIALSCWFNGKCLVGYSRCDIDGHLVGNRSNTYSCYIFITFSPLSNSWSYLNKTAALPYANKNIYLFLGGFLIALSIERSGLHKRLALIMIKNLALMDLS